MFKTNIVGISNILKNEKLNEEQLYSEYGEKAFLDPENRRFPIINPKTGKVNFNMVYEAYLLTKDKENLKEIHQKAEKILIKFVEESIDNFELEEALTASHAYISRQAKLNRAIAAEALRIAKKKNDPLVKKANRFKKLWKKYVKMIVRKYYGLASQSVRAKMVSGGKK